VKKQSLEYRGLFAQREAGDWWWLVLLQSACNKHLLACLLTCLGHGWLACGERDRRWHRLRLTTTHCIICVCALMCVHGVMCMYGVYAVMCVYVRCQDGALEC